VSQIISLIIGVWAPLHIEL